MIHLDLFSGIGGFALAVEEVWPRAEHIFCEIDPYCRALLKKRFEGSVIYGDIRQLTADTDRKSSVDLLTGGFPCQPFSQAGKRRGTEDNRYLWPEMLRVIREFKPRWVIAENVRGLINIQDGLVFEQVCLDLENEGYEVQPFIIPAIAVNAPHRRDRVWIVANRKSERSGRCSSQECGIQKWLIQQKEQKGCEVRSEGEGCYCNAPNTKSEGLEGGSVEGKGLSGQQDRDGSNEGRSWNQNWLEVATELCGMDDGLPAELHGLKLSKSRHRIERLKALGNAIVPQVAIEIMKAIKEADELV